MKRKFLKPHENTSNERKFYHQKAYGFKAKQNKKEGEIVKKKKRVSRELTIKNIYRRSRSFFCKKKGIAQHGT